MILKVLINFSVLFTFAVFSYWPFQETARFRLPYRKLHPYFIGILTGITGVLSMQTGVFLTNGMVIDARHIIIIISGLTGGPIATIISGVIIGFFRMYIQEFSYLSILAGFNLLIIGVMTAIFSIRYPVTFRNAPIYFAYGTVQSLALIIYLSDTFTAAFKPMLFFIFVNTVSFIIIILVLDELHHHFSKMKEFESLAETDYLTGLHNNRKLHQIISEAIENNREFSILSIDIDLFRNVNDTFGHFSGDTILKDLAKRLRHLVEWNGGILARNGGEEFLAFFPNSPGSLALDVAEQLRKEVAEQHFIIDKDRKINITISIGISTYPDNGNTIKEIYKAADLALHEAKLQGRNHVIHYVNRGFHSS